MLCKDLNSSLILIVNPSLVGHMLSQVNIFPFQAVKVILKTELHTRSLHL